MLKLDTHVFCDLQICDAAACKNLAKMQLHTNQASKK